MYKCACGLSSYYRNNYGSREIQPTNSADDMIETDETLSVPEETHEMLEFLTEADLGKYWPLIVGKG